MEAVLGESGASMELVRKPVPMRRRVSAFQGERPSELWKERERERDRKMCDKCNGNNATCSSVDTSRSAFAILAALFPNGVVTPRRKRGSV